MEQISEVLKEHEGEVVGSADLAIMLSNLKFEWALRLELVTHRLRYWRQVAKSCTEEVKPFVLVQIDENEATFKTTLDRYSEIKELTPEEFVKQEIEQITKLLKQQLLISTEDLNKKQEQLNLIKDDTEKFGFLDKVYGEEQVDTEALEQYLEKEKQTNAQLIDNLADWEMLTDEDKSKYVYIKNNSSATFAFANSVVDEFKKSTVN